MYFFLVILFILCVGYWLKVRSSRLCKNVFKLPANSRELPIIGSGLEFLGTSEEMMKNLIRMSHNTTRLGGATRVFSFNIFYIVITDALIGAEVLRTYPDKDYLYSFVRVVTGNGSTFAPASIAKAHRQAMLPAFSLKILNNFVDVFWKESIRLVEHLEPLAGAGPVPLEKCLNTFVFETIIKTAMDVNEGFCGKDFLHSLSECMRLTFERIQRLWYHPDFTYKLSVRHAEVQRWVKTLYQYADQVAIIRRNELKKYKEIKETTEASCKKCLFDTLLKSKLSDEDIRDELVVLIGGTELASISMGYTLMLLAQYPAVQDKVYEELQDVFGGSDRAVVKDDLIKLNYLDMVIKESLRLYPPAPFVARQAFKEVTLSSGMTVPAGAGIVVSIIGLHRNPKYWGPEAEHFDPERFSPERFEKVHPNAYIPFSFGPRSCIGYKYGQMAMKVALSTILRKYKIVGEPASGPVPSIRTKFEIFMKPVNHFEVEFVKRNK